MAEMGPPGMGAEDMRLAALKAHQKALEEATPPEPASSLEQFLLPLIAAQGIDFLSTEKPMGFNVRDDMRENMNKFPGARAEGFAGTAGRIGSGAAELALAALLHKVSPKIGNAYAVPSITTHTDLARGNWNRMNEKAKRDRLRGSR